MRPTEKQIEAATAAIDTLAYDMLPENLIHRAIAEAALSAALTVEAGTDTRSLAVEIVDMIYGYTMEYSSHPAAHADDYDRVEEYILSALTNPASSEDVAKHIVQGVCELQYTPDPEDPDTIMVTVGDLEAVICNRLASFRTSPASSGVEGEAVAWRTMDSAPKDGTAVFLFNGKHRYIDQWPLWEYSKPILWQPLPAAPTLPASSVKGEGAE